MTLLDLCDYLHNNFEDHRVIGKIKIEDSAISGIDIENDRYFRIIGSVFNDDIYKAPATQLKDETFDGSVILMSIPPTVLDILSEINAWEASNSQALNSPYQSESFGGYSYTKATGSNGEPVTWRNVFGKRLNAYRKI